MTSAAKRDRVQKTRAATVLVAASNAVFRRRLQAVLRQSNYRVIMAEDGPQTLGRTKVEAPDLVILGPQLRPQDGEDTCRLLGSVLVLVLSESSDEKVVVQAFDQGADDHVVDLPVRPRLLLARIRALLRWQKLPPRNTAIVGNLKVDFLGHQVLKIGREVEFSRTEFDLFA